RDVEVHARPGVPQRDAVRGLQHDAAAARHDGRVVARGIHQLRRFERPEARLASRREEVGHARSGPALDLGVQVNEGHAEPPGDPPSDRGLPRSGHPDEVDDHGRPSRYRSRFPRVSPAESPPNFSRTASARTKATTASPTTPPAGTAQTSVRCLIATAGAPVSRSTVRSGRGTGENGFIPARSPIGSPVDTPPPTAPAPWRGRPT